MRIINNVKKTIKKYSLISKNDSILVGLSGGPDSICLLKILALLKDEYDIKIFAAYIDHGLRPEEIINEKKICYDLCSSLNIPYIEKSIDVKTYVEKTGHNKQEVARELRYNALYDTAVNINANKIALGHNADDQAETVIMRILRGSGPTGLSGIPPIRIYKQNFSYYKIHIIRPLIEIERTDIERFLQNENLAFVVDSSNLKNDYLRNKIRHFLMPSLKKINRNIVRSLCKTADILRDEERYFELIVTKSLMKLISRKSDNHIELFLSPLESMDTVLIRRVLRRALNETAGLRGINFCHIEDIISLIKWGKAGDRLYLPHGIRAIKGYSNLIITSQTPQRISPFILDIPGESIIRESSIVLQSHLLNINNLKDYGDSKKSVSIDFDKLKPPLKIRSRLDGDFFYPFGLGKKKKLQDFFVDEKIPRDERDSIPLLVDSCNNIVSVIGYRIDDRYKVDKNTKIVLKLVIKPLKE
jgi:tRNA(Ile)-lysidine synthase